MPFVITRVAKEARPYVRIVLPSVIRFAAALASGERPRILASRSDLEVELQRIAMMRIRGEI